MMAEVMKNRPMKERHMLIRDRASITARTMPAVPPSSWVTGTATTNCRMSYAADAAAALVKDLVPENGVLNLLGDGHHLASQPFIRGQQGVALVVAQEKVRLGKPGGQGDEILQAGAGGLPVGGQIVPGHVGNELRVLAHFAAPLGHGVVIAQGVKRHAQQQKRQQHHARRQQELLPIETVEPAAEPGDLFLAHFTSNL